MNVIYAGNTLGDLSRNMLLGQQLEDDRLSRRAEEALRSRMINTQDRQHRDEMGLGYAGIGERGRISDNELAFQRYAHDNLSAGDRDRNQLLRDELNRRLAEDKLRWNTVSPDVKAQIDAAQKMAELNTLNSLATQRTGYPTGKVGDEMLMNDRALEQSAAGSAIAMNQLLEPKIRTALVDMLDSGGTWDRGLTSEDAEVAANALLSGSPVPERLANNKYVLGARQWFTGEAARKAIDNARAYGGEMLKDVDVQYNPVTGAPSFVGRKFVVPPSTSITTQIIADRVRQAQLNQMNQLYPPSPTEIESSLNDAQSAISKGADQGAVRRRLLQYGITPNF